MSAEIPTTSPEKREKQVAKDNARKFLVEPLSPESREELGISKPVTLTTHFLDDQKKIVRKAYPESKKHPKGKIEIWLIQKVFDENGDRITERQEMPEENYNYEELCRSSVFTYKKDRFQFEHADQNGILRTMSYDEFDNDDHNRKLCMLEVDAPTKEARDSFNPTEFPVPLTEVSGVPGYTGSEIIGTLQALAQ